MSVQQKQAPVELKTFKKYRDQFNQNVIDIVNILNQVFNQNDSQTINPQDELKPNLIEIDKTIPGEDIFMNLIAPKGTAIGKEKEKLLKKVCKNIVLIYTHPLPNLDFNIDPKFSSKIPLANQVKETKTGGIFSKNMTKNIGKFGVKANNLEQYSYSKQSEKLTDISDEICKQQPVKDFQEYLYNKLYVLVKLRGILNLNDDDKINQYEIFFERNKDPKGTDKRKAQTKIEKAEKEFNDWFEFIKGLFQIVLSDKYNNQVLNDIIGAFNTTNVNTNSLCKSLVPLCDTSVDYSEDDIKDMCVETKLESVREPIICEVIQQKAATQKRINGQNQKSNDLKQQLSKYRSKEDKKRVDALLKTYNTLEETQKQILSNNKTKEQKENELEGSLNTKDEQLKEQQKLLEELEKKAEEKKTEEEKEAEKVKTIVNPGEEIELKDLRKKIEYDKPKDELTQPEDRLKKLGDVKRIFKCLGTDELTTEINSAIKNSNDEKEKEILEQLLKVYTSYRKTEK